jgi:hypothetical protein
VDLLQIAVVQHLGIVGVGGCVLHDQSSGDGVSGERCVPLNALSSPRRHQGVAAIKGCCEIDHERSGRRFPRVQGISLRRRRARTGWLRAHPRRIAWRSSSTRWIPQNWCDGSVVRGSRGRLERPC